VGHSLAKRGARENVTALVVECESSKFLNAAWRQPRKDTECTDEVLHFMARIDALTRYAIGAVGRAVQDVIPQPSATTAAELTGRGRSGSSKKNPADEA
jgi:hypothetical protein